MTQSRSLRKLVTSFCGHDGIIQVKRSINKLFVWHMSRHLVLPHHTHEYHITQDAQEERAAGPRKGATILGPAEEFQLKYGEKRCCCCVSSLSRIPSVNYRT